MDFVKKIKVVIDNPTVFVEHLMRTKIIRNIFSDRMAISIMYRLRFRKRINLRNPDTFNEKLLWLTLYDRRPEYTEMVDKYQAKRWIAEKLARGGILPNV